LCLFFFSFSFVSACLTARPPLSLLFVEAQGMASRGRYHSPKKTSGGLREENVSCLSSFLNCRLRFAVPICCLMVCVFPLTLILTNESKGRVSNSKMRGSIIRANEFQERPLDSIVLVKIHDEALLQAEMSSVMHSIEDEIKKDVENMRLESLPMLEALEQEQQLETSHFHDASPGRKDAQTKLEARFARQKEETVKIQEKKMDGAREEGSKQVEKRKNDLASQIESSILKHRAELGAREGGTSKAVHRAAMEVRRRMDASNDLLHYFCSMEDRKVKRLAVETGRRGAPYTEDMCIGSEGVTSPLPADYNNSKHFQIAVFKSHAISKDLTIPAYRHMRKANTSTGRSGRLIPRLHDMSRNSFRDAVVLIHPWLGVFYKVRVPLATMKEIRRQIVRKGDQWSTQAYRKECYRRPWAPLKMPLTTSDAFGFDFFKNALEHPKDTLRESAQKFVSIFQKKVVPSAARTFDRMKNNPFAMQKSGPTVLAAMDRGPRKEVLSIVLTQHSSLRVNSLEKLYKQISSRRFKQRMGPELKVRLIVVLCQKGTVPACVDKETLASRLKVTEATDDLVLVPQERTGGPWDAWARGVEAALEQVEMNDDPVLLLDGHVSHIPKTLVDMAVMNSITGESFLYPISYHLSPSHTWPTTYSNPKAGAGSPNDGSKWNGTNAFNILGGPTRQGYVNKRVVSVAFTKADGLAALEQIDFSERGEASPESRSASKDSTVDTPLLGSAVSLCGRMILADELAVTTKVHRAFVGGIRLHGWNRLQAERAKRAEALRSIKSNEKAVAVSRMNFRKGINASVSDMARNASTRRNAMLPSYIVPGVPFPMMIPETPFLGHSKCAAAADSMSYCESIGNCELEEFSLETIVDNPTDRKVLHCSANELLGTGEGGPSEDIESMSDVNRFFEPSFGYTFTAEMDDEPIELDWGLLRADLHI
jgi:hypothetical protein